jgi:two-component system, chemotaxis family, chemotaxis protein CheY
MARILIIDDDRMVREALQVLLSTAGYDVTLANEGKEGLETFAQLQPNLVITDILMPEKEGMETIQDLRRLAPTLPIIAISGGGRVGNMSFLKVAQQFGANRTFAKPFEPEEILDAVAELLAKAA